MSAFRLVLARHGETESNVGGVLDSRPPGPPLTDLGRLQAEALAEELAEEPVVAVYASVATRARQTAAPLAARHGHTVEVLEGVHEVQCGELEGRSDVDALRTFHEIFGSWHTGLVSSRLPGGESGQDVLDRFLPVLEELRDRHPEGTVVLVSHGAALRLVGGWIAENVTGRAADEVLLPNTGRVVLEADTSLASGWRCVFWTGHDDIGDDQPAGAGAAGD
ncbi:histidine phosphatase family protein [Actinoalloteichus sp. AHMU CJ021]|uniref:Phosphoglycerate mutase n=1 Tax=Actinoalloteichus caeruleus DSM 43889 TaxID=1120930 RepID=A0ABT1JKX6_ACTCY|nr:histidine phosphatase family protein [Actinoalloteichus caeruleus]AUS78689.1 histidine phosphatase family protein [Actinoalloteichus sp. AHMU CJ021]MCP2332834.1 putative phosphoglycerate mutase [Actinoalloteichus caeruleus DSM 43889]